MLINSTLLNTIKIQKNLFNTSFNFFNSIIENVQTAVIVNTPDQYKNQINSVLVAGETAKEKFNISVNDGFDKIETFCTRGL